MKKLIFFLSIAVLLINTGCKKYLYEGPINSTYGSKFWTTPQAAEQAAMGMYGLFRNAINRRVPASSNGTSHFVYGDLAAGTFLASPSGDIQYYNYIRSNGQRGPFYFNNIPYAFDSKGTGLGDWSAYYQVIAQADLIIKNVNNIPAGLFNTPSKQQYIAEALFMRAYAYYYMTRVWGDPVYVTTTFDDVDYGNLPDLPRSKSADVLDSCMRDLRVAVNAFGYANGTTTASVRVNKGSVQALMAEIFAWNHQYDSCHQYCQQVINNGGYSLEPMSSYTRIWAGQQSKESIFEIAMTNNTNDPNFTNQNSWAEAQSGIFGTFTKKPYANASYTKTSCWLVPPKSSTTNSFFMANVFDTVPVTNKHDYRLDTAGKMNILVSDVGGSDPDVPNGYRLLKYMTFRFKDSTTSGLVNPYFNNDIVMLRLSDMYLLDAEALTNLGDLAGARAQLAFTETRANITSYNTPNTQLDMLVEILKERGREFIGEGSWFYDLIRMETNNSKNLNPQWLEKAGYPTARVNLQGYLWPLVLSILQENNPSLTQTYYWTTTN
jgi:hypothetical protein